MKAFKHEGDTDWQSVAAALNSQLAAERESRDEFRRGLEQRIGEVDELREQLAAEKAKNTNLAALLDACEHQLAVEREVGHNTAVALGQQIIKLEDQLATLVDALKVVAQSKGNPYLSDFANGVLDGLAKQTDPPVQLPMINDDPVVTLK